MALNYVTITGTFKDGASNPLSGSVVFTPSTTAYAAGIPLFTTANPVSAQITGGALEAIGGGPLTLLATDNTGLVFEDLTGFFYWTVSINAPGVSVSFSFFLPHTPTTVDLFELANTGAGSGGGISLPVSLSDGGTGYSASSASALLAYLQAANLNGATFTGYIAPAVVALTQVSGAVAVNAALGNDLRLTLTASGWTISNPSSPVDGERIDFMFTQDSTGSRTVSWGTAYNFGAAGAPTLTTTASKTDILAFIYNAAKSQWLYAGGVFGY